MILIIMLMIKFNIGLYLTVENVFSSYKLKNIKYFCMGELVTIHVKVTILIIK